MFRWIWNCVSIRHGANEIHEYAVTMGSSSPWWNGRISQSVYFWNMLVNHAGRVYAANPGSIHPTDPTINVHGLGLRLAQIFRCGLRDWSVHARYRGSYGTGVRRDGRRGIHVHTMSGVRARPMENLFTLGSPRIASRSSPPEDRSWQQWRRQSMHITTVLCY